MAAGGQRLDEQIDWATTALLFLCPAIAGALFGYDIGASSVSYAVRLPGSIAVLHLLTKHSRSQGALLSLTSPEHSGTNW